MFCLIEKVLRKTEDNEKTLKRSKILRTSIQNPVKMETCIRSYNYILQTRELFSGE